MNPLMSEILLKAESIEGDITYNETKEYPTYLTSQHLMIQPWTELWSVDLHRLTKQDHVAYCSVGVF